MSTTVTGTPAQSTVSSPENSELADASVLLTQTVQPVCNNIALLHNKTRTASSIAAMQALTGCAVGDECTCLDTTSLGRYRYTAIVNGINAPWRYVSTANANYCWLFIGYQLILASLIGGSGIVATGPITTADTTPAGKIRTGAVQNQMLGSQNITGLSQLNVTVTANSNSVVSTHYCEISDCAVNDIVSGSYGPFTFVSATSSNSGRFVIEAVEDYGGTPNVVAIRDIAVGALGGYTRTFSVPFWHQVGIAGLLRIRMHLYAASDVDLTVYSPDSTVVGQVSNFRP